MDIRQPVKNLMTRSLTYVKPDTSLGAVAEIFENKDFHHVPVLDNKGEVIGMVSKSDYLKLLDNMSTFNTRMSEVENEKLFRSLLVGDFMSARPTCVHEDASVESAIQVFVENQFRALPVVSDSKLVGIVTPIDIMGQMLKREEV